MDLTHRNYFGVGRAGHSGTGAPRFVGGPIDNVPHLLEQSYRLRYEVYCLERDFLPAGQYPAGQEIDEFDRHALHVGAVDASGALAATSRAVKVSAKGLPLFDHCTSFPHEIEFHRANPQLVEVGRLVVGRGHRRSRNHVVSGKENVSKSATMMDYGRVERRRVGEDAFMTVLKALYDETKRIGATHWLTAMQEPLRHQLAQQGFPFRAFGPECEYYGVVVPYQMAIQELDAVIRSGRFRGLDGFAINLQPGGLQPGLRVQTHEGAFTKPDGRLPVATVPWWEEM